MPDTATEQQTDEAFLEGLRREIETITATSESPVIHHTHGAILETLRNYDAAEGAYAKAIGFGSGFSSEYRIAVVRGRLANMTVEFNILRAHLSDEPIDDPLRDPDPFKCLLSTLEKQKWDASELETVELARACYQADRAAAVLKMRQHFPKDQGNREQISTEENAASQIYDETLLRITEMDAPPASSGWLVRYARASLLARQEGENSDLAFVELEHAITLARGALSPLWVTRDPAFIKLEQKRLYAVVGHTPVSD